MYSGTTFSRTSGRVLGAHQKIDRVARRVLGGLDGVDDFPSIRDILHFEGKNGPDGVKRKSPAQDEPWHYYNPTNLTDGQLLEMIQNHSANLQTALQTGHQQKAAFEAAWLAHAIVDGLTPAHHFPLEEELERLRGAGLETRTNFKEKLMVRQHGDSHGQVLSKNWQFWGAKGIMTTHLLFEIGVATTILPLALKNGKPNANEFIRVRHEGFEPLFKEIAGQIYGLRMYENFHKRGWTPTLARQTRRDLAPLLVKAVVLAWYEAAFKARKTEA